MSIFFIASAVSLESEGTDNMLDACNMYVFSIVCVCARARACSRRNLMMVLAVTNCEYSFNRCRMVDKIQEDGVLI